MGGRIVIPGCKSYMTVDFPAGETPSHGLRGLQRMPRVITDGGFDKQSKLGIWRVRNREIMLRFWELHRTSPRYQACCRSSSLWRHAQPEPSSFCRKPLHVSALWCHARPQSRGFLCAAAHSYTLLHYGTTRVRTSSWSPPRFRTIVPRAAGHSHRLLCAAAHSYTFPRYVAMRCRTASRLSLCFRTLIHVASLCCHAWPDGLVVSYVYSHLPPWFRVMLPDSLIVYLCCRTLLHVAAIWRPTPRRFLRVPHPPPQCRAMAPRAAILDASSTTVLPRRALAAMKGRTVVVQSIYRSRHWIVVAVTNDVDLSVTVTFDIC